MSVSAAVSDNIQVSPDDNNVYSTTAAAYDPTNHANLFAAATIVNSTPVTGFASADGGASWGMQRIPLPDAVPNRFGFYPGAAFDLSGNLYASSMAYSFAGGHFSSQLVVSKSFDEGRTWRNTSTVTPWANPEKPLIAVDTSGGPHQNRVYVAYDSNPGPYSEPIMVAHSDDGLTWTPTVVADYGGDFGASPAIGPNGEVYVAFDHWCDIQGRFCSTYGRILLAKSENGGNSFTTFDRYGAEIGATNIGFEAVIPNYSNGCTNPPIGVNPAPSLDVDRSGGVHNGRLYAVWADQQPRFGRMHIMFASSSDGGPTWTTPIQLDIGNLNDAWQPALSVDRTNGAVTVAWYDRRDDPGNKFYRAYYTQSTDGGLTFLRTQVPVATSASDPTLSCFGTGDYMQMASVDGVAHPFWSDTRNGRNQIFTASVDEASLAQTLSPPSPLLFAKSTALSNVFMAQDLAVGDFYGHGKTDIAVLNYGRYHSIFKGRGDGSFAPPSLVLGSAGQAIAVGDLNKDGKPDLVISGSDPTITTIGNVKVHLGNGDGTFQGPVPYPSGGDCTGGLAVADLGNGSPDVVVVNRGCYTTGSVAVLLGNGDGTLQAATTYPVGTGPTSVAIASFRGNGKLDLAVTNTQSGTVSVLFGNGNGTFQPAVNYNAGIGPVEITVGDFNGDGKPDIAVVNQQGSEFSVLLNKGDGTFLPPVSYTSGYNNYATSIGSGDFDGDGTLDLVVSGGQAGKPVIWLGKGDGTFTPAGSYWAGYESAKVLVADLNGDHHPDLIVLNQASLEIGILLGATRTAQPQPTTISFPDQFAKTVGPLRIVSIPNHGTADLHIATADLKGPNARDFTKVGDTCSGAAVPAGMNCSVSISFAPMTPGNRVANLQITDDAGGSPQLVALSGIALLRNPNVLPAAPPSSRGLPPPPSPRTSAGVQWSSPSGGGRGAGSVQPVQRSRLRLL